MKKYITGLFIILMFSWGCTANLMLTNVRIDRSFRPSKTGKIAIIASVNYWSGNYGTFGEGDEQKTLKMKETLANMIYNTGLFDDVIFTESAARNIHKEPGKKYLYLDVVIYTVEIGSFNWWISWPGVYPMPAYWPIQRKKGTVAVNIEVTVSDEEKALMTTNSFGSAQYSITFYGFFRTWPIERSAEKAFIDAGSQLKTNLARIDAYAGKAKALSQKNLVGAIYDIKSPDEIIIKHSTDRPLRMGELIFAEKNDSKIKMIVHFPMLSISKCRLVKNADYSSVEKNMNVYRN